MTSWALISDGDVKAKENRVMFDPRDPYERYHWHYDSQYPLSIAQIIAGESVDTDTVALIWFLLKHGASLTVAGPTDPQPGVGKTTTVNALLQLLPTSSSLIYMSGMNEDFSFTTLPDIDPSACYALCNEVSDHSTIYMWGQVAHRYLTLPTQGYHILTSVHADTINDVIRMYHYELRLTAQDIRRLGIIVNIGLIDGHRRWFTTHFIRPVSDTLHPEAIVPLPLSIWKEGQFHHMEPEVLQEIVAWTGSSEQDIRIDLKRRSDFLGELAQSRNNDMKAVRDALEAFQSSLSTN